MASKVGSTKVPTSSRPSFVMGSRPSNLYAPRSAPRAQGNILKQPPSIVPQTQQRNYGKADPSANTTSQGFGNTGLSGES